MDILPLSSFLLRGVLVDLSEALGEVEERPHVLALVGISSQKVREGFEQLENWRGTKSEGGGEGPEVGEGFKQLATWRGTERRGGLRTFLERCKKHSHVHQLFK